MCIKIINQLAKNSKENIYKTYFPHSSMFLEELPLKEGMQNITNEIVSQSSETMKQVTSNLFQTLKPFLEILGGLIGLYIIYKIISSISNHLLKKRVKRIDENVQGLQKKLDEILSILKKKSEQKSKKEKKSK